MKVEENKFKQIQTQMKKIDTQTAEHHTMKKYIDIHIGIYACFSTL